MSEDAPETPAEAAGPETRDQLYEAFARIGAAASSPRRLRLLNILCQGEKTVEALAAATDQSLANTSAHLKVLKAAHLVTTRRDGRHVHYRIADPAVLRFWLAVQEIGQRRLPEVRDTVRRYFEDPGSLEPLDAWTLLARVERGEVLLLDLRPEDEYRAGHIPGARSIPYTEIARRLDELPKGRRLVAYCRGPYCLAALGTVRMLREEGYDVKRLNAGIAEWQAEGRPVERIAQTHPEIP